MASLVGRRCLFLGFRGAQNRVLGISGTGVLHQQKAGIVSPANYRLDTDKPAPWPYKHKKFMVIHQFFDSTEARFDENSKVICVDGNIAVGKSDFAQALADNLEFHYVPPVSEKDLFWSSLYDIDLRYLNHFLPKEHHYYDLKAWLTDPHPEKGVGSKLQLMFYMNKILRYAEGLHHLYNTGQGVVFDGCSPFSDVVFAEAMHNCGWMSKAALHYYEEFKRQTIYEFFKPHLTIYLDAPPDFVMKKLEERDHPVERGSKVLTEQFVKEIDRSYKKNVLPVLKKYGEVLVYDAVKPEPLEAVVEEIERLNLDYDVNDEFKFIQWEERKAEDFMSYYRRWFGSKHLLTNLFNLPLPWHCPEMMDSPETHVARKLAAHKLPTTAYERGYHPEHDDPWWILLH